VLIAIGISRLITVVATGPSVLLPLVFAARAATFSTLGRRSRSSGRDA
ncbi:MAG: hypothetical protein JWO74_832, partial [Solirubrobacterales bacterium]|nr:hypothetical protein [Solirubrobacterales bacterium]